MGVELRSGIVPHMLPKILGSMAQSDDPDVWQRQTSKAIREPGPLRGIFECSPKTSSNYLEV